MSEVGQASVNVDENLALADGAQQTANDANAKNSANSQQIANINDPNYLTPFEKPQLEIQMDNFATIYATDKDIATTEGIDFTAYDAAYQAYLAYMTPLTADISTYSPIVRATFNSLVTAFQNTKTAFDAATKAQYTQAMDKAKTDIANGQASYAAMQQGVADMKSNANSVATIASAAISSAGFANDTALTASQAASSAVANALSAQSAASDAVEQASSAATDSKDAKQIAGAVSQSYKTLTDGSTMTIAELQGGLAVKLTKDDLDGYATQTWAQNQIKTTADGINGTISSIKGTVDGQTTDINDLKADSNSFKAQFTTVNGTLSTQSTDIGTLQASSKELSSNFSSLNTDNNTNKNDISELKQTAKGLQTSVSDKVTQDQLNLLSGQLSNVISQNGFANMIVDNDFMSDTVGGKPTWWTSNDVAVTTSPAGGNGLIPDGQKVLEINGLASGNNDNFGDSFVNVQSGDEYYFEMKTRWESLNQTGSIRLGLQVINSSGATVGWYTGAVSDTPGNWVKSSGTVTIPDGATQARVWLSWQGSGGTGQWVFVTDLIAKRSTASQSEFVQMQDDINMSVKKGDVVNQFNIDAGGALLQTVGGNTKIVLSAPNIIFDTANPVQIPSVNIEDTLTGKTIEAGTITATTKITGSDIEASLIHSPDNSFTLDGNTGDIVGPSIHAADNSWGISSAGKIHGTSITSSVIDVSGDGGGPDFDNIDSNGITADTAEGIYSSYKYTVDAGYDTGGMHRQLYKKGFLVINGDTFLDRAIGDWSADGGGKYIYDSMYEAHAIKMRAYAYTGSDVQTDDPTQTQGAISSRLDVTSSAITMGENWSTSNPALRLTSNGGAKFGNFYFNSGHTMESMDGGDIYLKDNSNNMVNFHVKTLSQSSLLSKKTDLEAIDPHDALTELVKNDVMSYHYKTDDPSSPKSVSVILDDVNQIPKYYTSNIFKSADGAGRNDGAIVGYLMLSVKDLNNRLQKLEGAN